MAEQQPVKLTPQQRERAARAAAFAEALESIGSGGGELRVRRHKTAADFAAEDEEQAKLEAAKARSAALEKELAEKRAALAKAEKEKRAQHAREVAAALEAEAAAIATRRAAKGKRPLDRAELLARAARRLREQT